MTEWIDVSDVTPRIAYTATASQTVFTIPFVFFEDSDLKVYQNATLLTLGTHYSATGEEDEDGGTLTLVTGATVGDEIMIVRDVPYEQTTHIPPSGPLDIPAINIQFSKFVAMIQQIVNFFTRSIHFPDNDSTTSGELAAPATRANRLLGFDSAGAIVYAVGPTYVGVTATGVATVDSRATAQVTTFDVSVNLVITGGYASVADGGGAIYKRGAGSGSFTDGGAVTWSLDLSHNIANVMAFGAKGDGTTDDSVAIQAAITAVGDSGVVYFPPKTFKLVTGITVIGNGVSLRGAGYHATTLLFSPTTSDTTLITVGDGVLLRSYGGIYDLAIYSTNTTLKKTAISIISMDIYTVDTVTINGSAGWTGAGSIGIKIQGRDMQNYNRIVIVADQCIYIGSDPLSPATGLDQSTFTNLLMTGVSATLPLIDVQTGVGLGNITFDGYQAWTIGAGGFRWIDTTSVGVSQGISFNNIRSEQSLDPTQYLFDIQHNTGIQCLSFNNVAIGDRLGWRLRKCQNTTITGSMHTFAGRTFDVTSSDTSLEWINCALGTVAASSLTGVYQQYAFPSNVGGALPMSAKYLVSTNVFQNKSEAPWGSDTITVANNANALITNTTSTSTVMVIVSTSIGTTAIYALNGTNHTVAEVSDPSGQFTIAVGTAASTNIYWSAGNARYEIENKTGSSINYTFTMLGRAS